MMIYHRLLFIFVISSKQSVNSRVVVYLFIVVHRLRSLQQSLFSAPEIFIHMVRKTDARKWSGFMALVSGACVNNITPHQMDVKH